MSRVEKAEPQGHQLVIAYPNPGVAEVDNTRKLAIPRPTCSAGCDRTPDRREQELADYWWIRRTRDPGAVEFFRSAGPDYLHLSEFGQCVSSPPVNQSVPRLTGVEAIQWPDVGVV